MDANEHDDEQVLLDEDDDEDVDNDGDGNFVIDEEAAELLRRLEQYDPDLLEIHVGDDFPGDPNLDLLGRNSHVQ